MDRAEVEARVAEARKLPGCIKPVMSFDDQATGRRCLWARWHGEDWLFWKHLDGQWVSWRILTPRDREILGPLLENSPSPAELLARTRP